MSIVHSPLYEDKHGCEGLHDRLSLTYYHAGCPFCVRCTQMQTGMSDMIEYYNAMLERMKQWTSRRSGSNLGFLCQKDQCIPHNDGKRAQHMLYQ